MKDRLLIFTTDRGFLIPTVAAAVQVTENKDIAKIADILIFLVDIGAREIDELNSEFRGTIISFVAMFSNDFAPPEGSVFHRTHVPVSTLARLSVGELIPHRYDHIVYLDGDIRIVGDILPLVGFDVTEGRILAACDAMWLYEGDLGPYWRRSKAYLSGIGVNDPRDYFNAGVLAFRRKTWIDIANEAKTFFLANSERCQYHDQSALNAVCVGRRDVLSPDYNFISNYADIGRTNINNIRIIHFTGAAKPWFYAGPPWNGQFIRAYESLVEKHRVLRQHVQEKSSAEIHEIGKAYRFRRRKAAILTPWINSIRNRKFNNYRRLTDFAL